MRNKAILILLVFLALTGLVCFFWGNTFIAWGIENIIQAITGAKADIEGFRLNLFQMSVQIESVQITNPSDTWKNIVDTKKISFKLAPGPLFEGKTVIDEIVLEELTFNTKRRTDGKLKKKAAPEMAAKKPSQLQKTIATMPILKPETIAENLDLKKITASYQFKTDLSADRIKGELKVHEEKWNANLAELNQTKAELQSLDKRIAQLKKPDDLAELKKQLDLVEEIRGSARQIKDKLKSTEDQFKNDNQALEDLIKGLKEEAEADYQELLSLAKLPDLSNINYAEILLGETITNTSATILSMVDTLQKSLPVKVENPPKAKPVRGQGQNIVFPGRKTYPRFLIKKIAISGRGTPDSSLDGFYASGTLTGITSEPPIYGLPLTAAVFAQTANQASLRLDGQLNHVSPAFNDRINLTLKDLPMPQIDLGDNEHLPTKILDGKAQIDAVMQMAPDLIKLEVLITAANLKADFSGKQEPDDLIAAIVRKTLANINQVTINCQVEQSGGQLDMKIASNLNRLISDGLKEAVGEKVTGFTNELRAKVDAKLQEGQKTLAAIKQGYQQKVDAELNQVRTKLNTEEREIEAKKQELEARKKELEREQQQKIEAEKKELEEKLQKELERLKDKL
jgi:uncharacterized protein (TIGR03545 family)